MAIHEIHEDGPLAIVRRRLDEAVHALGDEIPIWDRGTARWSDSVYSRLRAALVGRTARGRVSMAGSRVPCRVAGCTFIQSRKTLGLSAFWASLVTASGTMAEMDPRSMPGLNDPFDEAIDDALNSLPANLRAAISNVEIVVEDEPPDGQRLLGLYQGVPLSRRTSAYSGVLPDKITIFGGPITRLAAGDAVRLRLEIRHVVLHEMAHHFGISDERLIELDRY